MGTRLDQETVRALAYRLWEQRGKPIGSPEVDWWEAERRLMAASTGVDESVKESFPASDPPASRLPDEPPVNAEAKWAAAGVDRDQLSRRTMPSNGSNGSARSTASNRGGDRGRRVDSPRR